MAILYKCPNIGNCSKSSRGETIYIMTGAPATCSECGGALILAQGAAESKNKNVIFTGIFLGLLFLGVTAWLLSIKQSFISIKDEPTVSVMTGPSPFKPLVADTILRFHGSNTIGGKLIPVLATAFLQRQGFTNIHTNNGIQENELFIVGEQNGRMEQIEIQDHGSETAFADLAAGLCDIGMSSRKIKPEEQKRLLPILGDLSSNSSEHVIAIDGIAIIVNQSSSVKTLSVAQVADVFSGKISRWSELGGKPEVINIYARDEKSGTFDFFQESVLKPIGKPLSPKSKRFEDSNKLSLAVSEDANAIGFVGLNYVGTNKVVSLSDKGVEPRKPSLLTIKTEDYLLSRRLYLYTAPKASTPMTSKFIDFVMDSSAHSVIASTGLVNLDVTPVTPETDDVRSKSDRWISLTKNASEIPTRFRFRTSSDELDARANRDIGRIVYLLSNPPYQGKKVILIGFADASGSPKMNIDLSKSRAVLVKDALTQEGINVEIAEGLGAEAFVALNDTDEHKEKNRRVEIWVR